jgi:hypothetical protein
MNINVLWHVLYLEERGRNFLRKVYKHVKQCVSFSSSVIFGDKGPRTVNFRDEDPRTVIFRDKGPRQ